MPENMTKMFGRNSKDCGIKSVKSCERGVAFFSPVWRGISLTRSPRTVLSPTFELTIKQNKQELAFRRTFEKTPPPTNRVQPQLA